MRILRASGLVRADPTRVFAVLEDARLADQLLPEFLRLAVVTAPWIPRAGERTRLHATYRKATFQLETELAEYRRGSFLLERQVEGPFASLEHAVHVDAVHVDAVAEDADAGGGSDAPATRVTEVLAYSVRLGFLGRAFDALALRRDLETALDRRLIRLRELLERG